MGLDDAVLAVQPVTHTLVSASIARVDGVAREASSVNSSSLKAQTLVQILGAQAFPFRYGVCL